MRTVPVRARGYYYFLVNPDRTLKLLSVEESKSNHHDVPPQQSVSFFSKKDWNSAFKSTIPAFSNAVYSDIVGAFTNRCSTLKKIVGYDSGFCACSTWRKECRSDLLRLRCEIIFIELAFLHVRLVQTNAIRYKRDSSKSPN